MKIFLHGFILIVLFAISVPIAIWGWSKIEELSTQTVESYNEKLKPATTYDFQEFGITFEDEGSLRAAIESVDSAGKRDSKGQYFKYNDIEFNNKDDLLQFMQNKDTFFNNAVAYLHNYYDVKTSHGKIAVTMTTAFIFGLIGGITGIFYRLAKGIVLETKDFIFAPLFSGMMGFIVLGFSEFVPLLFQSNTQLNVVRPSTLFFLCFFCGLASEKVFELAREFIVNIFKELTFVGKKT